MEKTTSMAAKKEAIVNMLDSLSEDQLKIVFSYVRAVCAEAPEASAEETDELTKRFHDKYESTFRALSK